MQAPDTVWVDYLCSRCGRAERQRADVSVFCPCNRVSRKFTLMTELAVRDSLKLREVNYK